MNELSESVWYWVVLGIPNRGLGPEAAQDHLREASPELAYLAAGTLRRQNRECAASHSRARSLDADFEDHFRVLATVDEYELTSHALFCLELYEAEGRPDWTLEDEFRAMRAAIEQKLPKATATQLSDLLWDAVDRARRL